MRPRSSDYAWNYIRSLAEFVILLLIAVQLFRTWIVEAYRVPSGSMACTLLGLHFDAVCDACGNRFACGAADDTRPARIVCPQCGYTGMDPAQLPIARGDRLLVSKGAFAFRSPRRWEVAVFRSPHQATQAFVKRIVGLPGESIEIREGDLFVDGQLVRKDLAAQRAMSVLVHDAQFESTEVPPHWQSDAPASLWHGEGGRFVFAGDRRASAAGSARFDWLSYRNYRRSPSDPAQIDEVPISDRLAYNTASRRSEEISLVSDVRLAMRVLTSGPGNLGVRITDGRDHFEVHMTPATGQATLFQNGTPVRESRATGALFQTHSTLEISVFDKQLLATVDDRLLFEPLPYEPSRLPYTASTRPIAIGASDLVVELTEVQVYRDVYYTDPGRVYLGSSQMPHFWGVGSPYSLGPEEYFVLGDNSAYSEDSRIWRQGPVVPERLMIGKPIIVHLPYRSAESVPGFQVPDFGRIRYIR